MAADRFLAMFDSDLFALRLSMGWWVPVLAAVGVLVAAALSQLPALRAMRRLDVATVGRERAV